MASKSKGGGGRSARQRAAPRPGSIGDIMRQRREFRATAPKSREIGGFELNFGRENFRGRGLQPRNTNPRTRRGNWSDEKVIVGLPG